MLLSSGWACCHRKSRAACAQSFALWQQATTEIMLAISLTIACSYYIYNGVILRAHPIRGESHSHRNTTRELQQHPLLFTTNRTDSTFFVWRLNLARPPNPGDSTILLRSQIPSGIFAKLRTVAASNNRDHARNLSYYCVLAAYIMVLFFTHIAFVVNHTIIATPPERLQQALDQVRQAKMAKILLHL